ncbi:hypothetical protein G6F32_017362 [Rhizopus arrhizus]|nr:hypothetical protein G6F32_017362 [Rhizopus arrhizus]
MPTLRASRRAPNGTPCWRATRKDPKSPKAHLNVDGNEIARIPDIRRPVAVLLAAPAYAGLLRRPGRQRGRHPLYRRNRL